MFIDLDFRDPRPPERARWMTVRNYSQIAGLAYKRYFDADEWRSPHAGQGTRRPPSTSGSFGRASGNDRHTPAYRAWCTSGRPPSVHKGWHLFSTVQMRSQPCRWLEDNTQGCLRSEGCNMGGQAEGQDQRGTCRSLVVSASFYLSSWDLHRGCLSPSDTTIPPPPPVCSATTKYI